MITWCVFNYRLLKLSKGICKQNLISNSSTHEEKFNSLRKYNILLVSHKISQTIFKHERIKIRRNMLKMGHEQNIYTTAHTREKLFFGI
jgi:hypothetical protein